MAQTTVDTLLIKIQSDMAGLRKDLAKIQGQTQQTTKRMEKSFDSFNRKLGETSKRAIAVGGALATAFAGLAIKSIVKTGMDIESLQIRLESLFGSANEGKKAFDEMAKFASKVPFSLEEIQRGSGALAAVADDSEELAEILKITGNVAAVTGLDFATTSMQIQRSFSAGIGAADLFRERAVRSLLGFQAGVEVSVEETIEKFREKFGDGGEFGKTTDRLADTLGGTLSMIGDKIFNFKRAIGDEGFFAKLKAQFKSLDDFLAENQRSIDNLAREVSMGLVIALEGLVKTIVFVSENLETIKSILRTLVTAAIIKKVLDLGLAFKALATSVLLSQKAFTKLNKTLRRNALGIIALGAAVVIEKFDLINKALGTTNDELEKIHNAPDVNIVHDTGKRAKQEVFSQTELEKIEEANKLIDKFRSKGVQLQFDMHKLKEVVAEFGEQNVPLASMALAKMEDELRLLDPTTKRVADAIESSFDSIGLAVTRTLFQMGEGMKGFRDIARNVVNDIMNAFIQMSILEPIKNTLFGGGGLSKIASGIAGFMGFGGLTPVQTPLTASGAPVPMAAPRMAGGGTVQSGMPTVVGERGAELFVPNTSGRIVNNQVSRGMMGSSTVVNQTINVETGVAQTVRAEMLNLLPAFKQETVTAVAEARLRGGAFANAFSGGV